MNNVEIDLLKEKVRRINKAKEKVKQGLKKYFNNSDYVIDYDEHNLMQEIVDKSFTLIKGKTPYLTVKIGIKENSENSRGINLFGEKFGDHPQSILLGIEYNSKI